MLTLTIKKVFLFCSIVRICSGINKLLQMYYYNSASRVFMVPERNIFFVSFKAEDSEQFNRILWLLLRVLKSLF